VAGQETHPIHAFSDVSVKSVVAQPNTRAAELVPGLLPAFGVLLHLAFLVSLGNGALNVLFNDASHRFGRGCDFFSIYAAGVKARLGESVYTIGGHVEQVLYAAGGGRYARLV